MLCPHPADTSPLSALTPGQIRIRDPNQGGKDITEEIMSGARTSSTPTPPQVSGPPFPRWGVREVPGAPINTSLLAPLGWKRFGAPGQRRDPSCSSYYPARYVCVRTGGAVRGVQPVHPRSFPKCGDQRPHCWTQKNLWGLPLLTLSIEGPALSLCHLYQLGVGWHIRPFPSRWDLEGVRAQRGPEPTPLTPHLLQMTARNPRWW